MWRLALASIRDRIISFGGAVLAIVFAASLVVACGVLLESAIRSDIGGTTRYEASSAVVQKRPVLDVPSGLGEVPDHEAPEPPPVPAALVERLEELPGVLRAVGDVSFYAQAVDPAGRPLVNEAGGPSVGRDWSSAVLTPFELLSGEEPGAAEAVVVDADLANRGGFQLGDSISIITSDGIRTFTISGIAAPPGRAGLEEQSTIFFSPETARDLAPFPDGFDVVGILGTQETSLDHLRQQLMDVVDGNEFRVLTGDAKRDAEWFPHQVLPETTIEFLGTASGLTGFVTIFIVASTFSFSIQQRGREIGLLRAVAATPHQITRLIMNEAAIVAIFGSAAGSLLGLMLVQPLKWMLIRVGITPPDMAIVYGPIPIIVAVVSSLVIVELAVFFAARRAARIQPSSALREASVERRRIGKIRLFAGLLFGFGGFASYYFLMQVGGEAGAALSVVLVMALCLAGGLLGPVLVWPAGWMIGGLLTIRGGPSAMLARANVLANRRRVASVTIPLMLTACFATLFLFIGAVQEHGVTSDTSKRLAADYVVVSGASEGLPVSAVAAIQELPEISSATGTLSTSIVMNTTPFGDEYAELTDVPARGVIPESLIDVLDLGVTDGALGDIDDNGVAISDLVARGRGLEVGDSVTMWLPTGSRITRHVVAIYSHSMGFADILLPLNLLSQHSSGQLLSEVFVSTTPETSDTGFRNAVAGLQSELPTLEVIDRQSYIESLSEQIRENSRVTYLLAGLAVIYTAIAIANTLMMSISERAREFARLRMIGATRRQIVKMVLWETVIVVTLGVGLGLGISLLANSGFTAGLFGASTLVIPWVSFLAVVAGVVMLGFASSVFPAWLASRSTPHDAIGRHE
jgi:putative ABC transport system permease protein